MRIWRSLEDIPADPFAGTGRSVVVIGNFDGVHRGHQSVIRRAREIADRRGAAHVVAVTFDPHPMVVLLPERAPARLTEMDVRCALLADAGVDDVLALPFSREIAGWSPQEFVDRVLVEGLHAEAVVVGENFRYGAKAAGDVVSLTESGRSAGFAVTGVDLSGGEHTWSSTYVRTCLAEGDVAEAARALARPYAVRGTVVVGDRRGRELGFPTANVDVHDLAIPADGVYATRLRRLDAGGGWLPAATSVGTNPTFAGHRERRVEAYVLDHDDLDLYGARVEVAFLDRVRGMRTFENGEQLVAAMDDDVTRTRELLAEVGPTPSGHRWEPS